MDNPKDAQFAEVRFTMVDDQYMAILKDENGEQFVGLGPTKWDAIQDAFHAKFPEMQRMELAPAAAWNPEIRELKGDD